MTLREKAFENIVGKRENAGNPVFSPFPTMLSKPSLSGSSILSFSYNDSTFPKTSYNFSFKFILLSANVCILDMSEILSFGKELENGQLHEHR